MYIQSYNSFLNVYENYFDIYDLDHVTEKQITIQKKVFENKI